MDSRCWDQDVEFLVLDKSILKEFKEPYNKAIYALSPRIINKIALKVTNKSEPLPQELLLNLK